MLRLSDADERTSYGACILHAAPEALLAGSALVKTAI